MRLIGLWVLLLVQDRDQQREEISILRFVNEKNMAEMSQLAEDSIIIRANQDQRGEPDGVLEWFAGKHYADIPMVNS